MRIRTYDLYDKHTLGCTRCIRYRGTPVWYSYAGISRDFGILSVYENYTEYKCTLQSLVSKCYLCFVVGALYSPITCSHAHILYVKVSNLESARIAEHFQAARCPGTSID